jgi:hypothetical protein
MLEGEQENPSPGTGYSLEPTIGVRLRRARNPHRSVADL